MMRIILLLVSAFILVRCSERDSYPAPVIVLPVNGDTFYPNELLTMVWEVPDSNRMVEMQTIASFDKNILTAGSKPFDTIQTASTFIGNQSRYVAYVDQNLSTTVHFGFRLKYHGAHGTSAWSAPRYYTLAPFNTLRSKEIVVPFTFDFNAQTVGSYYDEELTSPEVLDLDQLLISNGVDPRSIEFVKLDSGYVKDTGDYPQHIERIVFGFGDTGGATYPFDVYGGAEGLMYEPRVQFSPFGGMYRDLYKELTGKQWPMRLVYFLDHFQDEETLVGKAHHVEVYIRLKCYYK